MDTEGEDYDDFTVDTAIMRPAERSYVGQWCAVMSEEEEEELEEGE
jgi:hypothetical protein